MHVCWSATCMWILMSSVEGVRCPGAEFYGCWEPNQIRSILISCGQHLPQPLELCWGLDFCFCEVPAWPGYKAWKHGDVNTVRSLWPKGHGNQCVLPVLGGSFGGAFCEHPKLLLQWCLQLNDTQAQTFPGTAGHQLRGHITKTLPMTDWIWNVPHESVCLNTWVLVVGTVLEGWGASRRWSLMGEVSHWDCVPQTEIPIKPFLHQVASCQVFSPSHKESSQHIPTHMTMLGMKMGPQ